MANLKGGYVVLDLTDYDLTTDDNGYLTNEKAINYLLDFVRNYTKKPILLRLNLNTGFVCTFATCKDSSIYQFDIMAGVYEGNNFGLAISFNIMKQDNKVLFEFSEV